MLPSTMETERVRTVLMLSEDVRHALRIEASKRDVKMGRIVEELLEKHLPESLAEARRHRDGGDKPKAGRK